jgi:hypothetical protein
LICNILARTDKRGTDVQALDEAVTEAVETLSPERLAAANINPVSGLATDYLNHFNNVVMLLELIGDMPEMAGEILEWEPLAYPDYFAQSHFREKELAILAYRLAKAEFRGPFDTVVAALDHSMSEAKTMLALCDPPTDEMAVKIGMLVGERMKPLISKASGIINGAAGTLPQTATRDADEAQASIDELFP